MVEIIEHNDYNAPTNNVNIINGIILNPLESEKFLKGKFFKIIPNVWIHLDNDTFRQLDKVEGSFLLDKDYCTTSKEKTEYLKQMVQIFKRLNNIPTGKKLLEYLSRCIPLNPAAETGKLINKKSLLLDLNTKQKHVLNTLITAPKDYLRSTFKRNTLTNITNESPLISEPGVLYFSPNVLLGVKSNEKIVYLDPAICLGHELIHSLHNVLSLNDSLTSVKHHDMVPMIEKITFGGNDIRDINPIINKHISITQTRLQKTCKIINEAKDTSVVKDQFADNFYLDISHKENCAIMPTCLDGEEHIYSENSESHKILISQAQAHICESQLAEEFKVENRSTYKVTPLYAKEIDVTNPQYFTIKDGLTELVRTNKLLLHPAYINYIEKHPTYEQRKIIKNIDLCKPSTSKTKRDIPTCEPLYVDPLSTTPVRTKRHISCQSIEDEFLSKTRTAEEEVKKIPQKLLKPYVSFTIPLIEENTTHSQESYFESIKKISIPPFKERKTLTQKDLQLVDESKIPVQKVVSCVSYESGVIKVKRKIRVKKMLKAKAVNILFNRESPITFDDKNFDFCFACGDRTFSPYVPLNERMTNLSKGKVILNTGEGVLNLIQFGDWLNEVVKDFDGSLPYKDTLHKANDVLSILPYFGPALNIAVDIKDHNYLGAVETAGLLGILILFPEFSLPVMLGDMFLHFIGSKISDALAKSQVEDIVHSILLERDQALEELLKSSYSTLSELCIERVDKIIRVFTIQVTYHAYALMNNISYFMKEYNIIKGESNQEEIAHKIAHFYKKILNIIEERKKNIKISLLNGLTQNIIIPYQQQVKKGFSTFSDTTRELVKQTILTRYPNIGESILDSALTEVEKYIKEEKIDVKLKHEFNNLQKLIIQEIEKDENTPIPSIDLEINIDKDTLEPVLSTVLPGTKLKIEGDVIFIKNQRATSALKVEPKSNLNIINPLLKSTTLEDPFTINFWLRVPYTFNSQNNDKHITLIKNYDSKTNSGWRIKLKKRRLVLTYFKNKNVYQRLIITKYLNNKWNKITIINNPETFTLSSFINNKLANNNNKLANNIIYYLTFHKEIKKTKNSDKIVVQNKCEDGYYFGDFAYYNKVVDIESINEKVFGEEHLFDYFGNPIFKNAPYALIMKSVNNLGNKYIYNIPAKDNFNELVETNLKDYTTNNTLPFSSKQCVVFVSPTTEIHVLQESIVNIKVLETAQYVYVQHPSMKGVHKLANREEVVDEYRLTTLPPNEVLVNKRPGQVFHIKKIGSNNLTSYITLQGAPLSEIFGYTLCGLQVKGKSNFRLSMIKTNEKNIKLLLPYAKFVLYPLLNEKSYIIDI